MDQSIIFVLRSSVGVEFSMTLVEFVLAGRKHDQLKGALLLCVTIASTDAMIASAFLDATKFSALPQVEQSSIGEVWP